MIPEVYRKLGVRPVIHGSGTTTRYGGSGSVPRRSSRCARRRRPW